MSGHFHASAALPPGKIRGDHFTRCWVGVGTDLEGSGMFQATGIRSPDRPANSVSLYRYKLFQPPLFIVLQLYLKITFVARGGGVSHMKSTDIIYYFNDMK